VGRYSAERIFKIFERMHFFYKTIVQKIYCSKSNVSIYYILHTCTTNILGYNCDTIYGVAALCVCVCRKVGKKEQNSNTIESD